MSACTVLFGTIDYYQRHTLWALQQWSIVMLIFASVYTLVTVVMSLKHC
ncbi:hypothetical protein ACYATO_08685 [Lactobacillaceae bacterium Melli_B3]